MNPPDKFPIVTKNISDQIYAVLKERIIAQKYPPGSKIDPSQLREEFGVSNTPIKNVLDRLTGEGLIKTIARKGTFVSKLSRKELDELLEIREMMETYTAEKIINSLTPQDTTKIEQIVEEAAKAIKQGAYGAFMEKDKDLHFMIIRKGGNSELYRLYEYVDIRTRIVRTYHLVSGGKMDNRHIREAQCEHERILKAIKDRNLDKLKQAIHVHISNISMRCKGEL
jgi:DNA-binding GntR family transcriptional regulator